MTHCSGGYIVDLEQVNADWVKKLRPFYNKAVLKNFTIFIGKQLCWSLFLIELRPEGQQFCQKDTSTLVFYVFFSFWKLSEQNHYLKLVSAIFYQIFIFHQTIALQKLWEMFFISYKKLFLFLRYSNFCISVFPSFFPCQPLL